MADSLTAWFTGIIAVATVAYVIVTGFLWSATKSYVQLVQEQLDLLKMQLAPSLIIDLGLVSIGLNMEIAARCRHAGNPSSVSAILKTITLIVRAADTEGQSEVADEIHIGDFLLGSGRTWKKSIGGKVPAKIAAMPAPNFLSALFRTGARKQVGGTLTVRLRYQRVGQTETDEVVKEYEISTNFLGSRELVAQ